MSEYIGREAILTKCAYEQPWGVDAVIAMIEDFPAADVREVVTCDVCVWHVDDGDHFCKKWRAPCPDNAEFFCAWGERPNCGAKMDTKEREAVYDPDKFFGRK